jgi:light-regulated signal transduction histidine kinase (bacteriophytochrome)
MIDWKKRYETLHQEMVSLVHAVSHDLRAPLRAADGFSRVLLTKHTGQLDTQGLDYLQRIRAATALMGTHIDALTRLGRVTTAELKAQHVDLALLARSTLDQLHDVEPERKVEVHVDDGLDVQGDLNLLRTLMQNLLENAWKFTSKEPSAVIEFRRSQAGAETVYFVRDTGAGFDMAYAKHLFEPFGRLHPESEYPGAGIGLAICRRIVNRHGGRLWAEAAVGQGASFFFTIGELELES